MSDSPRQPAAAPGVQRPSTDDVIRWTGIDPAGDGIEVRDPATDLPIIRVADVGADGVDHAVRQARQAAEIWGAMAPRDRASALLHLAEVIEAHAAELSVLEALDVGKPIALVPGEIASAVDKVRFYAGAARQLSGLAVSEYRPPFTSMLRRDPVGVVAALTPWNYPFALAIWKIAPALAAGNAVVVKPSPETPLTTLMLARLADGVLPPGLLAVVTGGAATGTALVRHSDIDMIALTGGTQTGKAVMAEAARRVLPVQLELGGNAAVLIFEDADLDRLHDAMFMAAFRNSGQDCHAATRVYTTPTMVDRVAEVITDVARSTVVGDPFDPATAMGPLVSRAHRDRVAALVSEASAEPGVRVLTGGQPLAGAGNFYPPTVITGAPHQSAIVQQEIFGPVVTIATFPDERQAVRLANDVTYGLAASIWTSDMDRVMRITRQLKVGTIWVNSHGATVAEMPFGGTKESGFGRDLSLLALEQYTVPKHVAIHVRDLGE